MQPVVGRGQNARKGAGSRRWTRGSEHLHTARTWRRRSGVAPAVAAGLTLTLSPTAVAAPSAPGGEPACGAVVTGTVHLTRDLTCSGDGLIVGSAGATIDLAGHTLRGTPAGVGITSRADATSGEATPAEIVVRGGTISGFRAGIAPGSRAASITVGNVLIRNSQGAGIEPYSKKLTVTGSRFEVNDQGIGPRDGCTLTVSDSTFRNNRTYGLFGDRSTVTVKNSRFVDNQTALSLVSSTSTVQGNHIQGGTTGIWAGWRYDISTITDNTFTGATIGVNLLNAWDGTVVARNTFVANKATGLQVDFRPGGGPVKVLVQDNTFLRNGFAPGTLQTADKKPLNAGLTATVGTLRGNVAIGNAGPGIYGYVRTLPGAWNHSVTDGGKNIAVLNGGRPQCSLVVCSPR